MSAEPSTLAILTAIFLITLLTILAYFKLIKNSDSSTLRLPPGPRGLPIVGSLPFLNPDLHIYFADLAKSYGPVLSIRLGSKLCIVLTSPATAKEALKDKDLILANHDQPAVSRAIRSSCNDLLWSPYGPLWRALRKLSVHEVLSPQSVEAVRPLRRREVRKSIAELKSLVGQPVGVMELMFLTTLNILTTMLWGVAVNAKDGGENGNVGKELLEVLVEIINLLAKPNASDFFPALEVFDLQGLQKKMKMWGEKYERLVMRIADKQKSKMSGGEEESQKMEMKPLMQQVLMEAVERSKGDQSEPTITMDHVAGLLLDLVGGGTDTSATMVEWAMSELLLNPNLMAKVQEELDATIGRDKVVEESDLPKFNYLNAVVKETLRLHPALPLIVPHTPRSTCTVGGYNIPVGSRVFVNVWAIHRDPSFWDDPLVFRPERFLETDQKFDFSGSNFNYLPFGSGRRICAGIALADRMVMYMLASLLHSFDWHLPQGMKFDLKEKFGIVLKKSEPLKAIPVARLESPDLYN